MTKSLFAVEPATLPEILLSRAQTEPDRLAFAERDARLTYGELLEQASDLAGSLRERGVAPGDRVALALPAGLDFVRSFWAVQLLGAVSCALNPYAPAETIARRAERIRPKLLISGEHPILPVPARTGRIACPPPVTPDDIAVLQPTSGTSGESRTAMIRHRNIFASVNGAIEALEFGPHDVFVAWVPPWHDLGLIRFMVGSVYFGGPCHIIQPAVQTIPEWLATIARVGGTVTGAPDFAWRLASRLVDPKTVDLSSLQDATNGGEPVRLSTITAFEETFGLHNVMRPGYGLAELTLGATVLRPGDPIRVDARGNVSCGTALPKVEIRIDAEYGQPGEILVRGDLVFAGYFDAEEATRAILRDGWLHTGDIGQLDADGHLYVLGRSRAMLKRGGAILAPRELEEVAQEIDAVKIAAAVGLSTADGTEEIVVVVEVDAEDHAARVAGDVAQSIRRVLGFAPERVVVLRPRAIPRTFNGKLRHDALRAALADGALDAAIITSSGRERAG